MTVRELLKIISDMNLEGDEQILIMDAYTGADVKEINIDKNSTHKLVVDIDTEKYI